MSQSTIEQNRELARKLIEAISTSNWDYVETAFKDDAKVWVAGNLPMSGNHDKSFVTQAGKNTRTMFPEGMSFTPKAMTAEGKRVAVEAETYGEHFEGRVYNNHFHLLLEFEDGKVSVWKEYMDTAHAAYAFFGKE